MTTVYAEGRDRPVPGQADSKGGVNVDQISLVQVGKGGLIARNDLSPNEQQ